MQQILDHMGQITTIVQYVLAGLVGLLALDNAVDAIAKIFGNKKIDTLCGIIAIKIGAWINKLKGLPITGTSSSTTVTGFVPTAQVIVLFILLSTCAFAQTTPNTPAISISGTINSALQSVNVPTQIQTIQNSGLAVNTGFWYDWKASEIDATFTYPVFGSMKIGNWATWDYVNFGYASPNVLIAGTGLDINIGTLTSNWNLPASVKTVLNSASIGLTPMLGIENVGARNRFTGGPGGYVKITF